MQVADFLDALKQAADGASSAEAEFRRTIAERIAALERERSFAFRRLNLMRAMAEAAGNADSEEGALSACRAELMGRLGWSNGSEARAELMERFDAVARALHAGLTPPAAGEAAEDESPDIAGSLAAFEAWYAETRGTPFWLLFDHAMPETPLVDF